MGKKLVVHDHEKNRSHLVVGQRVFCSLHGGRFGYIASIYGDQEPDSKQSLSSVIMMGGGAKFDVIFENGDYSTRIPEKIIRSSQWLHFDVFATPETITRMLKLHEEEVDRKEAEKIRAEKIFQQDVIALKADDQFAFLDQGDDTYSGKLAAVNIRKELKRKFKGIKFSVRNDSYGSIRIRWSKSQGPEVSDMHDLIDKYKMGTFNWMEDIYKVRKTPWTSVFGGVKFLFCSRDM